MIRFEPRRPAALLLAAAFGLSAAIAAYASPALSTADQAFVAKVSQGGMFEVEASKLAERKAQAQDVKDQATGEVHDHLLVGANLKSIAGANGDDFPLRLNADFQDRLGRLDALSGAAFDEAYLGEMKKIHDLDGAAFAQEAKTGQNADLRAFSAQTVRIVERHIGALHPKAID